jgi:predicted N-acetyltransferase YhbS
MGRVTVTLRTAGHSDAETLLELWREVMRRGTESEQLADLHAVLTRVAETPDERIVVAEYDGHVAGAVHLEAATISAINAEPVVQALSPHVFPQFRRRGVGIALMEAAVAFAEERGISHVATAASPTSRDANRFFARLALGPQAVLRLAPTHSVRQRLTLARPSHSMASQSSNRHVDRVLAIRRVRRRDRVSS